MCFITFVTHIMCGDLKISRLKDGFRLPPNVLVLIHNYARRRGKKLVKLRR